MSALTEPFADGIEYLAWVPGKRHFSCKKLCAIMSTDDCVDRHARATAGDDRMSACRFCPIGAAHSGKVDPLRAPSTSAKVSIIGRPDSSTRCTRCGRSDLRIIHSGGGVCISCWNRQREWTLGRNARGTEPKTFVPLQSRRVGIVVGGERCYQLVAQTQNDAEPLARSIREVPDGLAFHDEQPGIAAWNKVTQSFEYRDRLDPSSVLLELIDGNRLYYVSVKANSLRRGEVAATPSMSTVRMSARTAAVWFEMDEGGVAVTTEWRPQGMICSSCCIAQIQARRFAGRVECRCPACGCSSTGRSRGTSIRVLGPAAGCLP